MDLLATIDLYGGGPGSGPNAPCPQCGPHSGHSFQEGDRVKVKPGVQVRNPKSGMKTEFKPGTTAVVNNVLPKVGSADQMVGIVSEKDQKQGKFGNMGYVRMQDLDLHQPRPEHDLPVWTKSWSRNPTSPAHKAMDIQPVPRKQVIMHTTTHDGASLTWVKPSTDPKTDIKTLKEMSSEEHRLKGDFGLTNKVQGVKSISRVYDTSSLPAFAHQGPGTTVHVDAYTEHGRINRISVEENNYTDHGQRTSQLTFSYKNAAAAVGMLKERYGIKTSLQKLRN